MGREKGLMMNLYGLIGKPLGHSLSAEYFREKFKKENLRHCDYRLFPIHSIGEYRQVLEANEQLRGLNVTLPFKKPILSMLDHLSPDAEEIGSVNCIRIRREKGKIITGGYNTDAPAFEKTFTPLFKEHHKRALVLGSGGSAAAVCHILRKLGIPYLVISRKAFESGPTYADLDNKLLLEFTVIINTTPLGMFPDDISFPPIPYRLLTKNHLLYDLVYNPAETVFMKKGKEAGASVKNGYEMFCTQAEMSWTIWQG